MFPLSPPARSDVAMVYDVMNQPDSRDSICATKEEREDAIKRYNLDPSTCYEKCQKMRNYRGLTIGLPKEFITEELTRMSPRPPSSPSRLSRELAARHRHRQEPRRQLRRGLHPPPPLLPSHLQHLLRRYVDLPALIA